MRIAPLHTGTKPDRVGHLEVFQHGGWFRVCAEGWGAEESSVACGNLGFPDFAPLTAVHE